MTTEGAGLTGASLAWIVWELARWQSVIDWGVGIMGAIVLVSINALRLAKEWRKWRKGR